MTDELKPCPECQGQGGTDGYDQSGEPTHSKATCERCNGTGLASAPPVPLRGWQPIESAPKDGTVFLAVANGADNRPLQAIVSYVDVPTMFSSAWVEPPPERLEIRGVLGHKYGVEFTHWMPLPEPPALASTDGGENG